MIKHTCRSCWYFDEKKEAFDKKKNEFVRTHYCNHPTKDGQKVGLLEKLNVCSQFKEREKTGQFRLKRYGSLATVSVLAFLGAVILPESSIESLLFVGGGVGGIFSALQLTEAYKKGKDGNKTDN